MKKSPIRLQRGVSLIEALLALVVMALGMLAVVGVQTTLRSNADVSRQRNEAVRVAMINIEEARSFASIEGNAGRTYMDITSFGVPQTFTSDRSNTTFNLERVVVVVDSPALRALTVSVDWMDRNDERQMISVPLIVARNPPELVGSLAVGPSGMPARQPLSRNVGIPASAIPQSDGTSTFTPPGQLGGGATWTWVFNNTTGLVTQRCSLQNGNTTCTAIKAQLLTGFVRLLLPPTYPSNPSGLSGTQVMEPNSTVSELAGVLNPGQDLMASVAYTTSSFPTNRNETCFFGTTVVETNAPVEYFCLVQLFETPAVPLPTWTGRLVFGPTPAVVASTSTSIETNKVRICRYFDLAGSGGYSAINRPLSNQNYVIIRAGDGSASYGCPATVTAAHQPT